MPAVTSHAAERGVVRVPHGAEVALSCGRGHFLELPRAALVARCDAGRYSVAGAARPLLELGCQRDVIEDVDHTVRAHAMSSESVSCLLLSIERISRNVFG